MSSLFYLVLFLSLHACNARSFGLGNKETAKQLLFSGKDVKLSSVYAKIKVEEKLWDKIDESINHEGEGFQNIIPMLNNIQMKEENEKGSKVIQTAQQAFQESQTETWKRQERSTLQSMPNNVEETIDPKENDLPEDIVVMDYAPAHRKPPIHNFEP